MGPILYLASLPIVFSLLMVAIEHILTTTSDNLNKEK